MSSAALLLLTLLVAWPQFVIAAETTLPQPRKKFRLHAVHVAYKTVPSNPPKPVEHPEYQQIGTMVSQEPNSQIHVLAHFDPQLVLPDNRFTWSGAAAGQAQTIPLSYGSEGNRAISVTVDDKNGADKTRSAIIRTRFVSAATEGSLCTTESPTAPLCPIVFGDALLASNWSASETANVRWGWLNATGADNGRSNAAKHAYWNVLMVRDIGAPNARIFADAHERDPAGGGLGGFGLNDGTPHNGVVMDLDNNGSGRTIGSNLNFETVFPMDDFDGQTAVVNAILGGGLTVMDDAGPQNSGNVNAQGLLQPSDR